MGTPFETASRFEPRGRGRYAGALAEDWYQGRGVYGGLVAAILARALSAEVGGDRPARTLSVAFCAPATAGEAEVRVTVERAGRYVTHASARLVRGDAVLATALATFGRARPSAVDHAARPMPALPPPDDVPPGPDALHLPAFCQHFEFRQALGPAPFSGGREARLGGWCRPKPAATLDAGLVAALLDAWAPAILSTSPEWAPAASIDLTVQLLAPLPREAAPDAHYAFEARCTRAADGYADELATLWAADGTPLASARQLVALFR
jgi:acyl-CoA thioesterase